MTPDRQTELAARLEAKAATEESIARCLLRSEAALHPVHDIDRVSKSAYEGEKAAQHAADLRAAAQAVRALELARSVCEAAAFFCEEINESTGECDMERLPRLHDALDKYEEFTDALPAPPEVGGMTAPWTPRERALRAALKVAETSLKRINSKASRKLSSECCSDAVTLVKITIECEKAIAAIRAALAEAPPPDPRDEALRLAEAAPDRARVRMMDADLKASQVELNTAKEELLKCVQWQHELRQQRAVVANQNRIQLTYLLECHRKGGITPLFLALEEYVQRLQGETK